MNFKLESVTRDEERLFFSQNMDTDKKIGCIGHLRGDFDRGGNSFFTTWFDHQPEMNIEFFKREFDEIINFFRTNEEHPILKNRQDMASYCSSHKDNNLESRKNSYGFKAVTSNYSYYFRCFPHSGDYNFYVYCYDNTRLMREIVRTPNLPDACMSVLSETGECIFLKLGQRGYFNYQWSDDREKNRAFSDRYNKEHSITKAQEEAMKAGSMFGWNIPGADPKSYDENGRPLKPKRKEIER